MVWFVVCLLLVMIAELYVIFVQHKRVISDEAQVEMMEKEISRIQEELVTTKALYEELKADFAANETSKIEEEIKEVKSEAAAARREGEIYQTHLEEQMKLREDTLNQLQRALDQAQAGFEEQKAQRRAKAEKELEEIAADFEVKAEAYRNELAAIQQELSDYRARREALNREIQREKAAREDIAFRRIQLSADDTADIGVLLGLVGRLSNKDVLYKLIWTSYLQKPFNQMIKNVLGKTEPRNVIYEIKNEETGEIYIGKTKGEVSKRWVEHIKTSLFIGAGKPSKIHEALFNHWGDFTFSVLEQVSPEIDLSEREKYWIDFFESNTFGYNIKAGG